MPRERRADNRIEFFRVIQLKALNRSPECYLGITRNISSGGLSFESQSVEFEPGENIEVVLKHPQDSDPVSCTGALVWKRHSTKFETFAGIRFGDVDNAVRKRILELVSFIEQMSSRVPSHENIKSTTSPRVVDIPVPEEKAPTAYETAADQDDIKNDRSAAPDTFFSEEENSSSYISESSPVRNRTWKRPVFLIALSIVATLAIILAMVLKNTGTDTVSSLQTPAGSMLQPVSQDREPVSGHLSTQKGIPLLSVQVGSWKNPEYAHEMLAKLKKDYPSVYIFRKKDFHIIRIPGILTEQEGSDISREIATKFHLQPIVVK